MFASALLTDGQCPTGRPLRVLIVEDDADAGESLAMLLRLVGFDVAVASNGLTASMMACDRPPDVLLMDLALPGMDGYQVARHLRGLCPSKPLLVAVTGYGQDSDRQRSRDEGFDHHLVKPVDPGALIDLLRTYARSLAPPTMTA
jgi:CheY-like chemotaxis protein